MDQSASQYISLRSDAPTPAIALRSRRVQRDSAISSRMQEMRRPDWSRGSSTVFAFALYRLR